MSLSTIQYPGTGISGPFSIPFNYISTNHLFVYVDGDLKAFGVDYTFPSASTIQLTTPLSSGSILSISRRTSPETKLVDYVDGSTLNENLLDLDSLQMLYLCQEATDKVDNSVLSFAVDGTISAGGRRVKDIGLAVNGNEAVTKEYVDAIFVGGGATSYPAANVDYIPAGTGAAATTVQTKLRESVSVKDFGAVGDGVADDTAALSNAIAYMASTGNNVLVNPGVYLSDAFSINSQVYAGQASFIGTDRERCIIRRRTAGAGAFVTYGASSGTVFQSGIGFERLTIDGGATTNGDAFVAYDLVRSQFRDVRFTGGDVACHLYGGISVSFYSCLFDAAKRGLKVEKFTSLAGGGWPNAIRVSGGEIVDNTECGAHFDDGRMFLLDGVEIEGNGTTLAAATQGGVYIGAGVGAEVSVTDTISIGLVMRGCWLEANRGVADVSLNSGLNSIADSNFFSQSTMVTNDIVINGGKYLLRNLNMSFSKTVNVLEGGSVSIGNVIENIEAANLTYDGAKTTLFNGASINLQQGRVPSVNGMTAPMILTGQDATSANPTITFSTAFKSGTTPLVFCQVINNGPGSVDAPETYSITRTGFTIRKKTYNGSVTTSNYSVSWVAIGESP